MYSKIEITIKEASWSGETLREITLKGPCDFKIENGFMVVYGEEGEVFGINSENVVDFKCYSYPKN